MSQFTIQAPDGRKITLEAPDEATALRGAQEWAEANPAYSESYFAQGTSGVNEGIANLVGAPVDIANSLLGLAMKGANATLGTEFQPSNAPVGGSQFFKNAMGTAIQPESEGGGQQFVRRIGQEVGSTLLPAGTPSEQLPCHFRPVVTGSGHLR